MLEGTAREADCAGGPELGYATGQDNARGYGVAGKTVHIQATFGRSWAEYELS